MKTETPKSKFVYPNKLYARTKDNKTLDISYAPQNIEAVEYTRTDAFINKAVQWLEAHADDYDYTWYNEMAGESGLTAKCIDDFENYMKG